MPSDQRVLIDAVVTRDDARGHRVTIQGTVVPTGQRVPSPGEAIRMEIGDLPFTVSIPGAMQAAGQEDIRRLLWQAFREVLSQHTITGEALRTLSRRAAAIAGQRMRMERSDVPRPIRPLYRPMEAGPHAVSDTLAPAVSDLDRESMEQISHSLGRRIEEETIQEAANAEQGLHDAMTRMGFNTEVTATGRTSAADPPTTNISRRAANDADTPADGVSDLVRDLHAEAAARIWPNSGTTREAATRDEINAARITEEDMPSASWPTHQRVLGRPEHPANPDRADGRELRNIKIRDRGRDRDQS